MNAIILFATFLVPVAGAEQATQAKALLGKMIESRKSFATAELIWTIREPGWTRYHRNRYDGKNWTMEQISDADGVVHPSQLGQRKSCAESRYLKTDGLLWNVDQDEAMARVWDLTGRVTGRPHPGYPVTDARTIGLTPELSGTDLDELLAKYILKVSDERFSVEKKSDGIVKVAVNTMLDEIISWHIDTKRGHNPILVEKHRHGGMQVAYSKSELAFYDGHVWFPKHVEIKHLKRNGPMIRQYDFEVAEFDRPKHPALLTPAHIGVVPYNTVAWQASRPLGVWTGTELTTYDQVEKRLKDGVILKADLAAWLNRLAEVKAFGKGEWPQWMGQVSYGVKPTDVDAWEKYVRRFCLIRKLDERQRASAKGILDDCRKSATPIVAKAQAEKDAKKKDAILVAVGDIFTHRLVPRLESQLTIAQSQPTTKPVARTAQTTPKP